MIPGIGRFDPGSFGNGGFEIVIGVGTYAERRDQMLAMYRNHHIAPRGMHVINKSQDPGLPELPEGGEMTMEMRQAIAAARTEAGYVPLPVGAKVEEVGPDLSKNEAYLDGIVDAPDWNRIGKAMDEALVPMTVVMPRELGCPSPEVASRVNRLFWEDFKSNPKGTIELCRTFAAGWIPSASKALTFWPPEVEDAHVATITYEASHTTRTADLEHYVVEATITPKELKERELTFRNWFANTLCAGIVEQLDRRFSRLVSTHASVVEMYNVPGFADDLVKHVTACFGDAPVAWLMDAEAQKRLDMVPGQIVENIPGSQAICDDPHPLPQAMILARALKCGLHQELPQAFEVEIEPGDGDELRVSLGYWNAMDVDPYAQGFAAINIGE